jgi:hypothetical protein
MAPCAAPQGWTVEPVSSEPLRSLTVTEDELVAVVAVAGVDGVRYFSGMPWASSVEQVSEVNKGIGKRVVQRIALSNDGLELAVSLAAGVGVSESITLWSRAQRSDAFTPVIDAVYANRSRPYYFQAFQRPLPPPPDYYYIEAGGAKAGWSNFELSFTGLAPGANVENLVLWQDANSVRALLSVGGGAGMREGSTGQRSLEAGQATFSTTESPLKCRTGLTQEPQWAKRDGSVVYLTERTAGMPLSVRAYRAVKR